MKNLESKIYDVLKEAGVPVKQAKKMAKKTTTGTRIERTLFEIGFCCVKRFIIKTPFG